MFNTKVTTNTSPIYFHNLPANNKLFTLQLGFALPNIYPVEGVDISNTYLHFLDWVKSSDASSTNWHSNTSTGYTNSANLYTK